MNDALKEVINYTNKLSLQELKEFRYECGEDTFINTFNEMIDTNDEEGADKLSFDNIKIVEQHCVDLIDAMTEVTDEDENINLSPDQFMYSSKFKKHSNSHDKLAVSLYIPVNMASDFSKDFAKLMDKHKGETL